MALSLNSRIEKNHDNKEVMDFISTKLREIRYGSVEVVVHDGRIVQIDKRERFRFSEDKKPG